ncbi:MAG: DNA mismatch repair protein MutS [Polyangiaceae bacterium]
MAETPNEVHARRRDERQRDVDELSGRASRVSTVRLVVAIAIIALVAAIVWAPLPRSAWGAVAALVLAFIGLVIVHARIHARRDRALAAVLFNTRALDRMSGKWRAFSSNGERWEPAAHPYADDLDVVGRASLFQLLDATSTRYGEEILARWLLGEPRAGAAATDDDKRAIGAWAADMGRVRERQAAVRDLADRVGLREAMAVAGSLLAEAKPDPRSFVVWARMVQQGGGVAPIAGWLRIVAFVLPVLTIGLFVLGLFGKVPRMAFLAPYAASMAVLGGLRPRIGPMLSAASSREAALSRYAELLSLVERESFDAPMLASLKKDLAESGSSATEEMQRLATIVSFVDARENEVFRFMIAPALMWDAWCALALERWRGRAGKAVGKWFAVLAQMEALASLAGFSFERPDHVFPELVDDVVYEADALGHPLIDAATRVANDVRLEGAGTALIVTGSNMSGKSTLLRAMGVAVVLAAAGAPVCAKRMRIGPLRVATSMRVSDSLEEGTSRFYAELKKLKLVLDMARDGGGPVLFLLDEILHGTNTRERLIGARALVRELVALGALGAVSTHDLALAELEAELASHGKHAANVHFQEQVEGEVMTFDYKLRPGVVQSTNALRLMKIVGLDVVAEGA